MEQAVAPVAAADQWKQEEQAVVAAELLLGVSVLWMGRACVGSIDLATGLANGGTVLEDNHMAALVVACHNGDRIQCSKASYCQ